VIVGALLVAVLGFVIGSFPTGVVITRLLTGKDVRQHGSGNIGAANVVRAAGIKVGVGVALLDIVKGVIPMMIGRHLGLDTSILALAAVATVVGHDFSIFLRFRGGKGVATTLGVMLALTPLAALSAIVTWVAVMLVSRYSSLASLTALAALPLYVAITRHSLDVVLLACALFTIAVAKHWDNLIRLANGKESKFQFPGSNGR
jgi:glycerol-3-phosphate acyltransferase PlsY